MNDERPIEKLLRRYAKKRRDEAGAPLELHPATRRLLQGEVARQFRKANADKDSTTGWWAALRRRWIYATAAVSAVVLAGVWLAHNPATPAVRDLARKESSASKAPAREALDRRAKDADDSVVLGVPVEVSGRALEERANAPALAAAEKQKSVDAYRFVAPAASVVATDAETALADGKKVVTVAPQTPGGRGGTGEVVQLLAKAAERSDKAEAAKARFERPATPPATAAPSVAAAPADSARGIVVVPEPPQIAGATIAANAQRDGKSAPTAAASRPSGAPVNFESAGGFAPATRGGGAERVRQGMRSQSFANVPARPRSEPASRSPAPAPVLLNFQIEQTGTQLRVVDADGSTYLGELAAEPVTLGDEASKSALAMKKETPTQDALTSTPAVRNVYYRVAGTNRTLNQQVEFTWNFLAPTNAPAQSATQAVKGYLNNQRSGTTPQLPGLYNNSGVAGRARINAGKEIEIRALPVNQ